MVTLPARRISESDVIAALQRAGCGQGKRQGAEIHFGCPMPGCDADEDGCRVHVLDGTLITQCRKCGAGGPAIWKILGLLGNGAGPQPAVPVADSFQPPSADRPSGPPRTLGPPPRPRDVPAVAVETRIAWIDTASGDTVIQGRWDWLADGEPAKACRWPKGASKRHLIRVVNLDAAGPLVVCEGAKAADAVGRLGFACIGLTDSGAKPDARMLAAVKGRAVIGWPDNDDPGVALMERAGAAALEAGAASVSMIQPHRLGLTAKGADAADWTPQPGVTARDALRAATPWAPPAASDASRAPSGGGEHEVLWQWCLGALAALELPADATAAAAAAIEARVVIAKPPNGYERDKNGLSLFRPRAMADAMVTLAACEGWKTLPVVTRCRLDSLLEYSGIWPRIRQQTVGCAKAAGGWRDPVGVEDDDKDAPLGQGGADFLEEGSDGETIDPLAPGLAYPGCGVLIHSRRGRGKTSITAWNVAEATKAGHKALVLLSDDRRAWRRNMRVFGALPDNLHVARCTEVAAAGRLERLVAEFEPDWLVIDNWREWGVATGIQSEGGFKDTDAAGARMARLKAVWDSDGGPAVTIMSNQGVASAEEGRSRDSLVPEEAVDVVRVVDWDAGSRVTTVRPAQSEPKTRPGVDTTQHRWHAVELDSQGHPVRFEKVIGGGGSPFNGGGGGADADAEPDRAAVDAAIVGYLMQHPAGVSQNAVERKISGRAGVTRERLRAVAVKGPNDALWRVRPELATPTLDAPGRGASASASGSMGRGASRRCVPNVL